MTDKELKELKDTLWHSADVLRASAHLAANKYGQPILGLIFLRYADILYKQHKEEIEAEYNRLKGGRMEKSIKEISIEKCGFYLPECAYYDFINDAPDDANKATIVKNAMEAIEDENPKMDGVLPKEVYAQLVPEEEPELLSNIVRIFKDIPENSTIDIFGEIYEYFLGNFALSEGKDGGTFYTPATVVRYMVEVLNPQPGEKKFLDPACGSGGMFVQAARYMHNHNASESEQMKFRCYGVEKEPDTVKLAKTKKYPVLSTRDDIIVLVDEAHRTQYKDLAENMRTALPNANFIAFTGTPLLGTKRLTNQWFGDYVSEYNFAQSVDDGSTVPLFYSRRVPEVGLENDFLDDDVVDIIEEENLNEDETRLLENASSRILEVIKRDGRLDKVAQDIAYHFPRRGFLGKGMVVSVDKYTAVKMYDKVQHYWAIEKQNIMKERNTASTKEERDQLTRILAYMNKVEMAVIISEENDEEAKFAKQGLKISEHRAKMKEITPDGRDIEDRFKDPNDSLQLVFVCAMWLTGFDVKNLSTLYLDKPMKGHTLMQAIARANRVYPGKPAGIIVDYVNVFKYMKKALTEYATGDDGTEFPAKDIDQLISYIDGTIDEADSFLLSLDIDLKKIIADSNTLDKLDALRSAYDTIVAKDGDKEKFKVILNTLTNLYEASKPEIFEKNWSNEKFAPLVYLHGLFYHTIDDEKVARARQKMNQILDGSVTASQDFVSYVRKEPAQHMIKGTKAIDLSKVDVEQLRKEIKVATYKAIEINDLKEYIEQALEQMLNRNCTRTKFSERFKRIIDSYNAGGTENEDYYEQLVKLLEELRQEDNRANTEGLTEEELEIYDLLIAGKKLTQAEEQKVKLSAKNLYKKLIDNRSSLLVVDWYKDEQPCAKLKYEVELSLNDDLPESYDKAIFDSKVSLLMNHFVDMAVQGYGWIGAA